MKKMIMLALVTLTSASMAFAANGKPTAKKAGNNLEKQTVGGMHNTNRGGFSRNYGMAGCGLGSMVMGNHDGQIFASTTNGTAGNQTFGITSGTSNCDSSPAYAKADRMDRYIVTNQIALADDIARGNGETLSGLLQVMNCVNPPGLNAKLQSNFAKIFSSHDLAPNEITDHILSVVVSDAELSRACGMTMNAAL